MARVMASRHPQKGVGWLVWGVATQSRCSLICSCSYLAVTQSRVHRPHGRARLPSFAAASYSRPRATHSRELRLLCCKAATDA
ncbi:hypothetical protein IE81DRAFT_160170 [Ceraceosorus guamensis]|uniref:Uncharacterized protein n=1 Tax=Ceraceosorus guamensis TaxID=1522189 RepID=A0A316VXQ1_9BASI|nr:hypothetical protein IE81DRAFT_160170 [Ceraceosorus guamensis]PWN41678.1 hypothetical protein IE81DRAFT_160170 [Ceraceosorus guamensis]